MKYIKYPLLALLLTYSLNLFAQTRQSRDGIDNVSSGLVNFEEFSEYADIAKEPHRSLMLQKYGIQFDAITGGNLAIAKVVNRGDSEPSFKAWLSAKCPGKPNNNRVCNGGSVGKRVLSMTNAKSTKTAELSLTLVEPVQSLSFDIIDVDGGETWTVTATDRDGRRLPSQTVSSSGYGGSSNNNQAKNFQVKTLGREIKSVRIHGTKNSNIFGFGFDNFVTGITVQTKSQCQDGLDNDSDGVTDFPNDFSCTSAQDNDETNIKSQCQDGLDNDTDGLIDLLDPGCSNNQDNNEADGTSQCQDGLDNDSDGATDFPNDFSCTSAQDNDETNIKAQCQDGADNDSDGATDFPNDFSCTSAQDNDENNLKAQCQDALDNDSDGATDFPNDFSCTSAQDNDETNIKAQCQDGADNDSDGATDFPNDFSCTSAQDNDENNLKAQCQDALDNDSDGATDFPNDFSCTSAQDNDETNIKAQCQDGIDNEGDGLIDLVDPGCQNRQDNNEGDGTAQCQDGLDNDSDGATDFPNDFSCTSAQDNDETNTKAHCQDGADNDSDGLIDLLDPGCSNGQDNNEADEVLKLAVGVDCVLDNFDGTKTAFFSYNNSTAQTINIAVGSTISPATKNEFSPGASDRGQPTSFAPGIAKGSVGVPLSGGTITWSVRSQGGAVSTATASAASPACAKVQPLAECQGFDNGVLRVLGGYQNLNNFEVKIPIGALNNFSPGNQNQGQPEKFLSGMNKGAFNINLTDTATVLMWTLNGLQAVASTALPICSGECVDTPVGSITEQIDQLAVQIADITKQAAAVLASAEATVAKTSTVGSKKKTRTQVRIAANTDRVDAERATAKANGYVKQSQDLTIQIPDVIKNCPEAPQFCQTVDNGPTIDALRDLFAQARNTAQRTIARAYFRNTGATSRKDKLVAQAKSLESQGLAQLDLIPRTSTECQ